MQKAKKYDWKDSNMALFGSDVEKKVKKESAESEPAWQKAGQEVGLQIWRIVKFKVEHWNKEQYGEFFSGDSYIVLNTYKQEELLKYDVHFWIGKYSTQDEYGTAAYKTVELDTFLEDKPIQHREVQGHESAMFKKYFPSYKLLKGGADTGFRRVLPEAYKLRLFHVKKVGRSITSNEVSPKRSNLRKEDVFLIDNGSMIYQYNGAECSHDEKFAAAQELAALRSQRPSMKHSTIEGAHCSDDHPGIMLLREGESKTKAAQAEGERKMFVVSDDDGSLDMDEIASGDDISKDLLKPENVFIINTGSHCFCWVGSGASIDERKNGLTYASNYVNKTETPYIPISVYGEGSEDKLFNESF